MPVQKSPLESFKLCTTSKLFVILLKSLLFSGFRFHLVRDLKSLIFCWLLIKLFFIPLSFSLSYFIYSQSIYDKPLISFIWLSPYLLYLYSNLNTKSLMKINHLRDRKSTFSSIWGKISCFYLNIMSLILGDNCFS